MTRPLEFTKMQGVGNDFVLIDGRHYPEEDWEAVAVTLCARRTGVGADGLLVLEETEQADIRMRMFNPDGSPDVCGNGLRCVVRYAVERGIIAQDRLQVMTLAGVRSAQVNRDSLGQIHTVTVGMGQPWFEPACIPMYVHQERVLNFPLKLSSEATLPITALSTGSTHAVTFVEVLPDDALFFSVSPLVENHPLFPDRTSLMWCVVESPTRLRIRIWERGAGETWGCGTGACAAAVAAILHGYSPANTPITIASRGGELQIQWQPGDSIAMTGPAAVVFEGRKIHEFHE